MKTKLHFLFVVLAVFAGLHQAAAQGARFFRVSGPAATVITAFQPNGTLVWSNALAGTNYTIQTLSTLSGGTSWVNYVQIRAASNVSTNQLVAFNPPAGMAFVPAGVFTMGNLIIDGTTITNDFNITDANPTNVSVSAFYMDATLVTSNQWWSIYAYATNHGYGFIHPGLGKASNHPVQTVDWYDCVKWSNARSQQTPLTPCYYTDAALTKVYTNGQIDALYVNWSANGYRLPTEAEWEKAARAGLIGQRFPWGNTISESQANYYGTVGGPSYDLGPNGYNPIGNYPATSPGTSPVDSFAPNGYGLYDMAGNVSEWCWDWYAAPPYPTGSPYLGGSDPHGPASGSYRILRGGDWADNDTYPRCAFRNGFQPNSAYSYYGFRCVKGL
jgi:formylglycine-generating enzyme